MKTKLSQNITYWLGVVAIGLVIGLSLQFVRAWTEPSVAPPGGNVGAPVNTSINPQTKAGGLGVTQNLIVGGNVGIGTTTPGIAKTYVLNNGSNPSVGLYIGNGTPFGQAKLELDGPQATHIWVAENKSRVFSVTAGGNVNASGDICTDQGGGKCLSAAGGYQYITIGECGDRAGRYCSYFGCREIFRSEISSNAVCSCECPPGRF